MTTETTPLAPTDAEIAAMYAEQTGFVLDDSPAALLDFARAVLARWGQPAPQQEPVAWYVTGCGRLLDEDEAKAEARHIGGTARAIPLYTTPQPTQAVQPAGREPEFDQFLSDVMTAAGLVTHGKQCKQLGERLGAAVMKLRAHGIKGGHRDKN